MNGAMRKLRSNRWYLLGIPHFTPILNVAVQQATKVFLLSLEKPQKML